MVDHPHLVDYSTLFFPRSPRRFINLRHGPWRIPILGRGRPLNRHQTTRSQACQVTVCSKTSVHFLAHIHKRIRTLTIHGFLRHDIYRKKILFTDPNRAFGGPELLSSGAKPPCFNLIHFVCLLVLIMEFIITFPSCVLGWEAKHDIYVKSWLVNLFCPTSSADWLSKYIF
jgi:hypothetical protein